MLTVASEKLELRGIATKQSKNGKAYYIINVETEDGTPYQFYCPDFNSIEQGLSKGDKVHIYFEVKYFKGTEKLEVIKVKKAS